MNSASDADAKKAYQPPRLLIYGDLAEMTKGSRKNANSDMGSSKNTT